MALLLFTVAGQPSPLRADAPLPDAVAAGPAVVEQLRLRVPGEARAAWLEAETRTWEPWLRRQVGFQERELLWDPQRQEGIILIHWASRAALDAIPEAEIDAVQRRFEAEARACLQGSTGSDGPRSDDRWNAPAGLESGSGLKSGSGLESVAGLMTDSGLVTGEPPFPLIESGVLQPLLRTAA
jgi:uncharacterized protein (TIGR03792 family)